MPKSKAKNKQASAGDLKAATAAHKHDEEKTQIHTTSGTSTIPPAPVLSPPKVTKGKHKGEKEVPVAAKKGSAKGSSKDKHHEKETEKEKEGKEAKEKRLLSSLTPAQVHQDKNTPAGPHSGIGKDTAPTHKDAKAHDHKEKDKHKEKDEKDKHKKDEKEKGKHAGKSKDPVEMYKQSKSDAEKSGKIDSGIGSVIPGAGVGYGLHGAGSGAHQLAAQRDSSSGGAISGMGVRSEDAAGDHGQKKKGVFSRMYDYFFG